MKKPMEYAVLIGVGALAVVGVFAFFKKQAGDAVAGVGGVLSGNNALTEGTPYAGYGFIGTLGAGANEISGGTLQQWGESLGGWLFDVTHPNQGGISNTIDTE